MSEGTTCYERDETLCEDQWCLRTGCRIRNERLAELQYEAGMYQSLYENAVKVLGEINQLVHVPTKATGFRSADSHYQADFDAIRKMTAPFSSGVGKSET